MATQEQLEELESVKAVYDGGDDVILQFIEDPPQALCRAGPSGENIPMVEILISPELTEPLDVSIAAPAHVAPRGASLQRSNSGQSLQSPAKFERLPPLRLRIWLIPEYLVDMGVPPLFELSCRWLQNFQLHLLCEHLEQQFQDQGDGPVIFVWTEWLRTESLSCLNIVSKLVLAKPAMEARTACSSRAASEATEPVEDLEALVRWSQDRERMHKQRLEATEVTCANCLSKKSGSGCIFLSCGHILCVDCTSAVIQVHSARRAIPACPLPQCRTTFPTEILEEMGNNPEEPWGAVMSKVAGTPFQDVIVFCPDCEKREIDIPILMHTSGEIDTALAGVYQCQCFRCHLLFCGLCRGNCHPGVACVSDDLCGPSLEQRRPPLASRLINMTTSKAAESALVFCPRCEILQTDTLAFMSETNLEEAARSGECWSECFHCQSKFCGVCRSPSHRGESCMSNDIRAVHMSRRRPSLPVELEAMVRERTQDIEVVFCPRCEEKGIDSEACIPSMRKITDMASLDIRKYQCVCSVCQLMFCGVCRMPCHLGKTCLLEEQCVEGMVLRRPPLPGALAELAQHRATEIALACQGEFDFFRDAFLSHYEAHIRKGLRSTLANTVELLPAPVSRVVQQRFLTRFKNNSSGFVCPGFHGTDCGNHSSIFQHGLLIPGDGNNLKVVHGEAYGRGVYVAKVNAAWLSGGFCSGPRMLVCAVIQSPAVLSHRDAMVVFSASYVVPLFEAVAERFVAFDVRGLHTRYWKPPAPVAISRLSKMMQERFLKQSAEKKTQSEKDS